MGAWGITIRQSDDGLDLLDTIVAEQLRNVNFTVFNVSVYRDGHRGAEPAESGSQYVCCRIL